MSSVSPAGATDRLPRSARALIVLVVVVFGFAFGGSARAALDLLSERPVPAEQLHPAVLSAAAPGGLSAVAASPLWQALSSSNSPCLPSGGNLRWFTLCSPGDSSRWGQLDKKRRNLRCMRYLRALSVA